MSQWHTLGDDGGYPPIAQLALIGDGRGCALVGCDGVIRWMCVPRFDSPPIFCALLDRDIGGHFTVAPEGLVRSRQRYIDDTGIVVTELATADGAVVELTDLFTLRAGARLHDDVAAGRSELLRQVQVRHGQVRLQISVQPRGGADTEPIDGGLRLRLAEGRQQLMLIASRPLHSTDTVLTLDAGDRFWIMLRWGTTGHGPRLIDPQRLCQDTAAAWREWAADIVYAGPHEPVVRRSAVTLKLLDHFQNGAIVAAATSSLPESIGGVRNWDYRYTWIRDAAFSVFALRRIGLPAEAEGFLGWVLDAVQRHQRAHVLYNLDGDLPPPEHFDLELRGYRNSAPVRWGNAAAGQIQHDIYGEILDCAFQWAAQNRPVDPQLWQTLRGLADTSAQVWQKPDRGIWEVRSPERPFTYSAAMCQVALDRAARLATRLNLPGPTHQWAKHASHITDHILHHAWNEQIQALTGQLRGDTLDASLLALPLRRVLPADHPRMIATTRAITEQLGAGRGLLYRYLPQESPDGLPGHEGAFLLCSFWLADNLIGQGHIDQAAQLFDQLCDYTNHVGLLSEQIDPSDGSMLGNFPQAFSHVGLISTAVALSRALGGIPPELSTSTWPNET